MSDVDLPSLAPDLRLGAEGIWHSVKRGEISYPAAGHLACFAVEDSSFWFRHRNRCIQAFVRRHFHGGPLLDVGGGNGYVARGLQQSGFEVVLVEPGPDGAAAARRRGLKHVACASLEDAGFRTGSFAAAGMFDVLEHIEDDVAALREVRRILEPGGRLFLTVPAYQALFSADDRAAGHFRRYTAATLSRVLGEAGFAVERSTYLFWFLPLPVFLLRTVPSWLGRREGADPEKTSAEHAPSGLSARTVDFMLDREYALIAAGKRVPFGGSCLMVARTT